MTAGPVVVESLVMGLEVEGAPPEQTKQAKAVADFDVCLPVDA